MHEHATLQKLTSLKPPQCPNQTETYREIPGSRNPIPEIRIANELGISPIHGIGAQSTVETREMFKTHLSPHRSNFHNDRVQNAVNIK